jgi:C4-dicarboxylate transporter DctQ subunit
MFVWMAKFGAAYGVRTGIHVGVDVLINQLPPDTAQASVVLFGLFCGALFTGIVGTMGAEVRHGASRTPIRSRPISSCRAGSSISRIPLGSYLMCFRFLQVAWTFLAHRRLPHHDPATSRAWSRAPRGAAAQGGAR